MLELLWWGEVSARSIRQHGRKGWSFFACDTIDHHVVAQERGEMQTHVASGHLGSRHIHSKSREGEHRENRMTLDGRMDGRTV